MKHVKLDMTDDEQIADIPIGVSGIALKQTTLQILARAGENYNGCVSNTPESLFVGEPSGCVGKVRVAG